MTKAELITLREEAGAAGDDEMVTIANEALAGNPKALAECVRVTTAAALNQLNDYTGDNVWQDVIYPMLTGPEWDAVDNGDASDQFAHNGVEFRFEPSTQRWDA